MRAGILFFSLFIFIPFLQAQEVFEADRPMSLGLKPAQVIALPLNDVRSIEKMWDDYMKEQGLKLKRNRKADEYYITEAELLNIGQGEKFELYSRVEEKQDMAELSVWIHLKDGFLTESQFPESTQALHELLLPFEKLVRIEKVKRALEEQEDRLKDLDKDLENLISDKEKYEQSIEQARQEIEENENNIEKNLTKQEAMKKKIEEQKAVIQKTQARIDKIKEE